MAVDKLVDSTQLDADLSSVADAIRAKSGGSRDLSFPEGFVSELGTIETLRCVTLRVIPESDCTALVLDNPLYPQIPKLVSAVLDLESYDGETVNLVHSCQFCTDAAFEGVIFRGYRRYAGAFRYYNSSGILRENAHTSTATENAPGVGTGDNAGKLQTYGHGTANKYKAGAPYDVRLYYWDA